MDKNTIADVLADFASSETIQASVIIPRNEADDSYRVIPTLQYLPSIKCLVFLSNPRVLTFVNDANLDAQHSIPVHLAKDDLKPSLFSLNSGRNLLLALGIPSVYYDYHHRIPAHIELVKIPQHPHECEVISSESTQFVNPHLLGCRMTNMKFFPDGSRLIIVYSNENSDSWCKIFTLPESMDDDGDLSNEWTEEKWSVPTNGKTLPCEDINVFEQGFPTLDEEDEETEESEYDEDKYFERYNERYYSSNLDGGFFCLAIAPDLTRILGGTNDAEIYVIDSTTLKVLYCKREYGYCKTVTGCHYNPLFAHEEFAVCNEIGILDIWNTTTSDDGSEEASKVHHLKFPPGTSNCVYSPDGQFIALTSAQESKTYIVSSTTATVMFTLLYPVHEEVGDPYSTYFMASSLFFGNSCQVATMHDDRVVCFWKLPVIYSLKTLCLIFVMGTVKYNAVEQLCLPTSLKKLLKYLYV